MSERLETCFDPLAEHGEIRFTVFGVAQPAGSKRAMHHKQSGKIIVLDSNPKSRDWKTIVGHAARQHYTGDVLTGPLAVTLHFYQPRPQGHYGKGRNASILKASAAKYPAGKPDVLKLARAVEDGLTSVLWRDDAQIVQEFIEKYYGEPARVEVVVRPLPPLRGGSEPGDERMPLTQPIKWHGGKSYLAPWIISHMPPRVKNPNAPADDDPGWLHYVEPFFGGGAVLLAQDPEGISEVVNDKSWELTNFWTVLQHGNTFGALVRILEATPFSEPEWQQCRAPRQVYETNRVATGDEAGAMVAAAAQFFVFCRQSMSGRMKNFTPLTRNRTRRGMNEQVSAWFNAVEGLAEVHTRLRRVVIFNDDALKVIRQQDGPRTLFYLDPPYMHETRVTTGEYGQQEMSMSEHAALLNVLEAIEGRFLLSGYPSDLYESARLRNGWRCVMLEIDNKASSKREKERKTECLWMNY